MCGSPPYSRLDPAERVAASSYYAAHKNSATDAGALEVLVGAMRAQGSRRVKASSKKAQRADLEAAARALRSVVDGGDAESHERRERAASLDMISVAVAAWDRFHSEKVADQILGAVEAVLGGNEAGPEAWKGFQEELTKKPALRNYVQEAQFQAQQFQAQYSQERQNRGRDEL